MPGTQLEVNEYQLLLLHNKERPWDLGRRVIFNFSDSLKRVAWEISGNLKANTWTRSRSSK